MASTTFSGPVNSTNGFSGSVLTAGSSNITTLTIGSTKLTTGSAVSGVVSAQLGYVRVMVGATTAYIPLYQSITL